MVAAIAPKSTISLKDVNFNFLGGLSHFKSHSFQLKPSRKGWSGREVGRLVVASSSTGADGGGRFYINVTGFPFPLGPFLNRKTIRTEVRFLSYYNLSFAHFDIIK